VALLLVVVLGGGVWLLRPGSGDAAPGGGTDAATESVGAEADGRQGTRSREIVFIRAEGDEIHILDGDDGTLIRALAAGEGGFLRGALRPLERERRRFDADPTAPYLLALEAGGRLTLTDPHSDFVLDVDAFGRSSRAEFMTLLPPPEG
jgi:putative photosynthetic complex assembly protein